MMKSHLSANGGFVSSFMKFLMPSATGCRMPPGPRSEISPWFILNLKMPGVVLGSMPPTKAPSWRSGLSVIWPSVKVRAVTFWTPSTWAMSVASEGGAPLKLNWLAGWMM